VIDQLDARETAGNLHGLAHVPDWLRSPETKAEPASDYERDNGRAPMPRPRTEDDPSGARSEPDPSARSGLASAERLRLVAALFREIVEGNRSPEGGTPPSVPPEADPVTEPAAEPDIGLCCAGSGRAPRAPASPHATSATLPLAFLPLSHLGPNGHLQTVESLVREAAERDARALAELEIDGRYAVARTEPMMTVDLERPREEADRALLKLSERAFLRLVEERAEERASAGAATVREVTGQGARTPTELEVDRRHAGARTEPSMAVDLQRPREEAELALLRLSERAFLRLAQERAEERLGAAAALARETAERSRRALAEPMLGRYRGPEDGIDPQPALDAERRRVESERALLRHAYLFRAERARTVAVPVGREVAERSRPVPVPPPGGASAPRAEAQAPRTLDAELHRAAEEENVLRRAEIRQAGLLLAETACFRDVAEHSRRVQAELANARLPSDPDVSDARSEGGLRPPAQGRLSFLSRLWTRRTTPSDDDRRAPASPELREATYRVPRRDVPIDDFRIPKAGSLGPPPPPSS
jgi:hypothetical protein